MLERYIVFLQDNTNPGRQTVTAILVFARTSYGAKRLGRIASREIFNRHGYGNNLITVNAWRMQQIEDYWYDSNQGFLKRSSIRVGKTVFNVADPTDTEDQFRLKLEEMQKAAKSLLFF